RARRRALSKGSRPRPSHLARRRYREDPRRVRAPPEGRTARQPRDDVTVYRLRLAVAADAQASWPLHNQGLQDRVGPLETEPRPPDERRRWLASRSPRHPVIVAETAEVIVAGAVRPAWTEGGLREARAGSASADNPSETVVAWASLNVFNAREAYRSVADISVYVERGWRGKGGGRRLPEKPTGLARAPGAPKPLPSAGARDTARPALHATSGLPT